jgi:hypothetical protein
VGFWLTIDVVGLRLGVAVDVVVFDVSIVAVIDGVNDSAIVTRSFIGEIPASWFEIRRLSLKHLFYFYSYMN